MIYGILQFTLKIYFKIFFRARILGRENVPQQGPVIVAANHMSNWDPPLLATFLQRPVSYMAKQELFEVPIFGWAITKCHAFPIRRGAADRAAIKTAVKILKLKKCMGVFPEGTRSKDGNLQKPGAGVALIAAMTGAPVVPAAIFGTKQMFSQECRFPHLMVVYGKPIYFTGDHTDKASLQEFSQKIMDEIARMIKLNGKDA